jgi:[acyl-carrier-protein] S-malonyltransferase
MASDSVRIMDHTVFPPQPRCPPTVFYSAASLGNIPLLQSIMSSDPYFVTQDNGAGAPIHFAASYCQLEMLKFLLDQGAEVTVHYIYVAANACD